MKPLPLVFLTFFAATGVIRAYDRAALEDHNGLYKKGDYQAALDGYKKSAAEEPDIPPITFKQVRGHLSAKFLNLGFCRTNNNLFVFSGQAWKFVLKLINYCAVYSACKVFLSR